MSEMQAVIFDLDDTLYPERDYAFSGFEAVALAFRDVLGDPAAAAARMRSLFDSTHRRRVFDQILTERGPLANEKGAAALVPCMIEAYRSHEPGIQLSEESRRVLSQLAPDYRLGIITDGPAIMQRTKLKALGLLARGGDAASKDRQGTGEAILFDAIVVTDEHGPGFAKPRSAAFELIVEQLGTSHDACTYVADNPAKDFVAPNALGWRTIRIMRAGGVYFDALAAPGGTPQITIASLVELPALLGQ